MHKLCTAFCAIGAVKPFVSLDALKVIFLLPLSYELCNNILGKFFTLVFMVFRLHKKVSRIITASRPRDSYRDLLKS